MADLTVIVELELLDDVVSVFDEVLDTTQLLSLIPRNEFRGQLVQDLFCDLRTLNEELFHE